MSAWFLDSELSTCFVFLKDFADAPNNDFCILCRC